MRDDKFLTLRLSPELYEALKQLAEENDRTIAAEARLAIRDRLTAQEKVAPA